MSDRTVKLTISHLRDKDPHISIEKRILALTALSNLTKHFINNPDFDSLVNSVMLTLSGQFSTANIFIAIWDPTSNFENVLFFCLGKTRNNQGLKNLIKSTYLQDYFAQIGDPAYVEETISDDMPDKQLVELQKSEIRLIAPIKHNDILIGIIGLGDKLGNKQFQEEDLKLFADFVYTINPIIENSFLFLELQHSEENYRALVDNISDGVLTVDLNEKILFINAAVTRILGYSKEELLGTDLRDIAIEEHRKKIESETRLRLNKEYSRYEISLVTKDGHICEVSVSAGPLIDNNGEVYGSIGIFADISQTKKAEREKRELQEKLFRAQRMESLGILAGGVAHDLNNILGPLVAYPELIRMKLDENDPIRKDILKIEKSALRASEVVQDLLTLARRGRYDMSPVDLNSLLESFLESPAFLESRFNHTGITIKKDLDVNLSKAQGSESHLYKVFMNLILNAMESMPDGGEITIKTEIAYLEKLKSGFDNIEPGKYIIISIRDTGSGISKKDLNHIFEPFYSKKEMGMSGSGLGLAIVYGIVKDHNGYIDVQSQIGLGSEFIVYLPLIESLKSEDQKVILDIHGSEKILVVDDIRDQRELASTILTCLGYEVATVPEGHSAVEYLKNNEADVVILDMIMEDGFDGLDTYKEILKLRPNQKAIIASGYAETDRVKEAEKLGVGKFIRKPYTMQQMGKAIREEISK